VKTETARIGNTISSGRINCIISIPLDYELWGDGLSQMRSLQSPEAQMPILLPGCATGGTLQPGSGGQRRRTRDRPDQRTRKGAPVHALSLTIDRNIAIEIFLMQNSPVGKW
jgi:hypothetical protein